MSDDETYDVPPLRPSMGLDLPPPLAPKKLAARDSVRYKEGLSRLSPEEKPTPMPRRTVTNRQSSSSDGITSPVSSEEQQSPGSRPVPKPRPRGTSAMYSNEPVANPHFHDIMIPPSADEIEDMLNKMVLEEQIIEEKTRAELESINGAAVDAEQHSESSCCHGVAGEEQSDELYENQDAIRKALGLFSNDRHSGLGANNGDYIKIWEDKLAPSSQTTVEDFDPFVVTKTTKPGLPCSLQPGVLQPARVWGDVVDSPPKVNTDGSVKTSENLFKHQKENKICDGNEEENKLYEALWLSPNKTQSKTVTGNKAQLEAKRVQISDSDLMAFTPSPSYGERSSIFGANSGDYIGLDPTYQIPPPAQPPPPLPADHVVNAKPPSIPPRPTYRQPSLSPTSPLVFKENSSHLTESSSDALPECRSDTKSSKSALDNLPTPAFSPVFQDDPFKYSEFDFQCRILNTQSSHPSAVNSNSCQPLCESKDSSFNFVEDWSNQNCNFVTTWPNPDDMYSEIKDHSYSKPVSQEDFETSFRLSQVPPPPPRGRRSRGPMLGEATAAGADQRTAAANPDDHSIYCLASAEVEPETQSIDSSDSSEDISRDPHRFSDSGGITFIDAVTPRKTERYGYLYKQGGVKANQGWRLRWVVFSGKDLRYYDNNRSQVSKKIIPLSSMKEVISDVKEGDTNRFKFRLVTTLRNRTFLFAADTRDDCLIWTSTLMAAILTEKASPSTLLEEQPKPDKEGFIYFELNRKKYYVAIWDKTLCYYDSFDDFQMQCPVHEIDMKLASVKDKKRNKLQLSTHYAHFFLVLDSPQEAQSWRMAIEDAIAEGLADDSVLEKVYENESNRICADCGDTNPHWASINMGIVLCKKCAGIHRMFELSVSKIRSLRMDTRVWTPSLIELMKAIGNANANLFWEHELMPCQKPTKDSLPDERKQFAQLKYQKRHYSNQHQLVKDKRKLNEALLYAVDQGNLMEAMKIIFSGADLSCKGGPEKENAYERAKRHGHRLLMELLYQNGGDCNSNDGGAEEAEGRLREDVRLQGYLLKTGPAGRTFDQRWCVLEHGALTYYQNERSTTAKDSVDRKTIYGLQEVTSERTESVFEISTSKGGNRVYTFAAENHSERSMWMRTLGKLISPVAVMEHVGMMDFSLASLAFMRESISEEWRPTWLMLSWRVLHYMSRDLVLAYLDLRKATQIRMQDPQSGSCPLCVEKGGCLVLMAPGQTFYIQANLQRDTKTIFEHISSLIKKSGTTLLEQQLTADNVPVIVDKCLNYILNKGRYEVGIYRKGATKSRVENLLRELRADAYAVRLDDVDVHEVANALKKFLRDLDDTLFMQERYHEWIRTSAIEDHQNKFLWYQYLLEKLPLVHYNTLRAIVLHISQMAQYEIETKMPMSNLATCFAPTLMDKDSESGPGKNPGNQIVVLNDLVTYKDRLFQIDQEQCEKIRAATEKINQLHRDASISTTNSIAAANVLIPVSMYSCEGQSEMVSTTPTTVAQEIVDNLCKKCNLSGRAFALSEHLFKGSIVRPLFPKDNIMITTGRWGDWDDAARSQACLCLTDTELLEKLVANYDVSRALCGELKYADTKSKTRYKKTTVEFKQCVLSLYKDSRAKSLLCSWRIEDLTIYLGIDPKRNPPTSYGFTFLVNQKDDKTKSNVFGHCLCLGSEEEMYRWVSALLTAQYPEGLLVWKNR